MINWLVFPTYVRTLSSLIVRPRKRQTAVIAYLARKQLLLLIFAWILTMSHYLSNRWLNAEPLYSTKNDSTKTTLYQCFMWSKWCLPLYVSYVNTWTQTLILYM